MKSKLFLKSATAAILACGMALGFGGCGGSSGGGSTGGTYYNNETDPLVFSTLEVDKVFNPFYSTTATDSNVVGMTQIGMLSNDSKGSVAYGENEACVTKDLEIITEGTHDVDETTTYYFVLKNNVKFSDGSPLTIKDVLFNLYVYLDPLYTGSSTIYSTEIVGLAEYRTQADTETEQDNFKARFEQTATDRIDALIDAAQNIFDDHKNDGVSAEDMLVYLEEYSKESSYYENVLNDYKKALELFKEELETDYSNSLNAYDSTTFSDSAGNVIKPFTTDVEVFLYNEGYITWSKKEGQLSSSLATDPSDLKSWTKDQAIQTVYDSKIPDSIEEVVTYWATATDLHTYITNEVIEEYYKTADRKYQNISGIQFANRTQSVTVHGIEYPTPTYNSDGSVESGYEVLSIKINGVDPKAVWNFSFYVAPMYYYSDKEHIDAFDFESNFGVEYSSQTFLDTVVKDPDKVGVPVGAGPYAASKSTGGIENISAGEFYSLGVIYFERNPYYVMGAAKVKKVRFQVVSSSQMLNTLYNGEVHFVEPSAKPETITELNGKKSDGIGYTNIQTSGYGYIGINAGKVPDLAVRQAIMHSINVQECVDYYQSAAEAVYRSMSRSNWAYPDEATSYYPYIGGKVPENLSVVNPDYAEFVTSKGYSAGDTLSEADQKEFITQLVENAGYTLNANGVYAKGTSTLKYTFTIAGDETDHPAWAALFHSSEILNEVGFQITVTTDSNALIKLATGSLTVWAAAWSSTIDPDMYQVYHKDSTASSVLNWGYKQILLNSGGKYDKEVAILEELSEYIELARSSTDEDVRKPIYAIALDLVMQLAVELPTYQRDDLFAYNTNVIDESSFTPEADRSPYMGLTSNMHLVSLVVEK